MATLNTSNTSHVSDASQNAYEGRLLHTLAPLLGRNDVLRELATLLDEHRVVTLFGASGIGKTRVAIEVAVERLARHAAPVPFVDLEPISDGALVATTIALAAGAHISIAMTPLEALVEALGSQSTLLVLDACERVVADVERVVTALLRDCPNLTFLCTSHDPLGVAKEYAYRVPPLAIPAKRPPQRAPLPSSSGSVSGNGNDNDSGNGSSNGNCSDNGNGGSNGNGSDNEALASPAVALFVARATALDPAFQFTEASAPFVARICRRLDGIPLAIELAAPFVKVFSVAKLAQALDDRFRGIRTRKRSPLADEQTLRTSIDWSYGHLAFDERLVFQRLSIFADTWSVDDAVAVCSNERLRGAEILALLDGFVEKSLVRVENGAEERRFRFHAALRAFARARLEDAGETNSCEGRRAQWLLARATDLEAKRPQLPAARWERAIRRVAADARAALTWALDDERDVVLGLRLVAALHSFYTGVSPREGQRAVATALRLAESGNAAAALHVPLRSLAAELAERAASTTTRSC